MARRALRFCSSVRLSYSIFPNTDLSFNWVYSFNMARTAIRPCLRIPCFACICVNMACTIFPWTRRSLSTSRLDFRNAINCTKLGPMCLEKSRSRVGRKL